MDVRSRCPPALPKPVAQLNLCRALPSIGRLLGSVDENVCILGLLACARVSIGVLQTSPNQERKFRHTPQVCLDCSHLFAAETDLVEVLVEASDMLVIALVPF